MLFDLKFRSVEMESLSTHQSVGCQQNINSIKAVFETHYSEQRSKRNLIRTLTPVQTLAPSLQSY